MTDGTSRRPDLTGSSATIPSDSENYSSSNNELSPSPPSSQSSPMILYSPPTIWGLLRGAAINLLLPFVNGLMLGFGELLAHEAAFRLGWSGTKFSSGLPSLSTLSRASKQPHLRPRLLYSVQKWPSRPPSQPALRFSSTDTRITSAANLQPTNATAAPTASSTVPVAEAEDVFALPTSLDDLITEAPPTVTQYIGFLKEMGLDYGWGPTAMVETLLEHIHIWGGTPWWASIALTVICIRVGLFKVYVNAQDATARMAVLKPYEDPMKERMKEAQRNRDRAALMKASGERRALHAKAGIKTWKIFMPFLQIPLGFGTFRLLRGMAYLPVPGFETGGTLWLQDLTVPDPYLILPITTSLMFYYTFKKGGETGSASTLSPVVHKVFLYVLPTITGVFASFWPGGLQLTIFVTSFLSMIQATAFRQPWFRNILGIHPLPSPASLKPKTQAYAGTINRYQPPSANASSSPPKKDGIFGNAFSNVKGAYSEIQKQGQDFVNTRQPAAKTGRRTEAEVKHAKAYEEKRKRELAQRKFENEQERQARREEKRLRTGR